MRLAVWCSPLVIFCTGINQTASNNGSGTGVGNGVIIGKVICPDNTPVANAVVRLRTESYLADTSGNTSTVQNDTCMNVLTGADGVFILDSIKTGHKYCIEVLGNNSNIQDSGTIIKVSVDTTVDTLFVPAEIVKPLKTVQGSIVLSGLPQCAYVQIYGIERIGRTDSYGKFTIKELPVGECEEGECEYELRVLVPQDDGKCKVYNYDLEIEIDKNVTTVELKLETNDDDHDGDYDRWGNELKTSL